MCIVLEIKRSSYYAWLKRPEAKRKKDDSFLAIEIKRVHKASYGTYGDRRIKEQLMKYGINCGKNRISKLIYVMIRF